MTWAFGYLAALLVGLVLAGVTGVLRDLRSLARHRLVVPHPDHRPPVLALLGRRLSVGLVLAGAVGLVFGTRHLSEPWRTLPIALAAGFLGFLVACLLLRRSSSVAARSGRAVVVREIVPGGYGQVRIERGTSSLVMAAQSVDDEVIPAGAAVTVVDDTRSVVTVRRQAEG